MKFNFKFSNLLGAVYRKGNLTFTNDGDSVISPVGNRITKFDLKNNKSETFPLELRLNITCVAISPDSLTAVLVDEDGDASLCSLISKTVLHHFMFRHPVRSVKYSPDGRYIAVAKGNVALVYDAPHSGRRSFNPLRLHRTYYGAYDDNTCIDWASDSRVFAVGSKDMMTRVFAVNDTEQFMVQTVTGHKDSVVAVFFEENSLNFFTIGKRCDLVAWECNTDLANLKVIEKAKARKIKTYLLPADINREEKMPKEDKVESDEDDELKEKREAFKIKKRKFWFYSDAGEKAEVSCADYHRKSRILVTGFTSGVFQLHEMPDFNLIHTLSISDQRIASVVFNPSGDWVALGCSGLGQLLVWEWQSECYVLKQQGHYNNMSCLDFSPDGQNLATGAEDGKVKVWNTSSGFCFVTFKEHTGGITSVIFKKTGKVIVSASLDGTVRAFDLNRYRNFRTFTSPRPAQFSCLAMDSSGEIICAAAQDVFEIFVWSMQTGRLLEVLAGHEGPVASLSFGPTDAVLASGSWDKTLKLWDVFDKKGSRETLQMTTDALAVTFRPDGCQVAVSTLDFQITFWDVKNAVQVGSIDGRRDLGTGRKDGDLITAKRASQSTSFTTLCYSADGACILAAGRAKNVCIYHVEEQILLKKFEISCNMSLDAMEELLNRRKMTDFGSMALIDKDAEDGEERAISLPGVRSGDMSSRFFRPEVNVSCVRFSPTGRQWAATTSEGLVMYSLDNTLTFDPFDLTINITPKLVLETLSKEEWSMALILAFRLNEKKIVQQVVETIPWTQIETVAVSLSNTYVEKMLHFISTQLTASPHLEFYLTWTERLLMLHGPALKTRSSPAHHTMLTALQESLTVRQQSLGKLCDSNQYSLRFLLSLTSHNNAKHNKLQDQLDEDHDISEGDDAVHDDHAETESMDSQDSPSGAESEESDTIVSTLYR